MQQAIRTYRLPATNTKGQRVKAVCYGGSVVVPWDYRLDVEPNHCRAAWKLARKLGEEVSPYELLGGSLPDGSYCWIRDTWEAP